MRSEQQISAEADVMQAKAFCAQFRADRVELTRQLARHVAALSAAANVGSSSAAGAARRMIRNVESEMRQIDRVIEGLEQRFPGAV